jgi:hypothetical protein
VISVFTQPGCIAFAVTDIDAIRRASDQVSMRSACLLWAYAVIPSYPRRVSSTSARSSEWAISEATFTMRALERRVPVRARSGRSSRVRRNGPSTFVAQVISMPSTLVRFSSTHTPALFTRMCSSGSRATKSAANARTEARLEMSTRRSSVLWFPVSATISSSAA